MKKTLTAAVLLAASLLGHAASAGELHLFSKEDFRGEHVVLQGPANNFREFGFNDRASSIVVRSGTWELCEHRDFSGTCAVFQRGEYADLRRFNNAFSSAREVGQYRAYDREQARDERWREREREREEWRERREERREDRRDYDGRYSNEREIRSAQPAWHADAVELFDDNGLGGRRVPINGDMRSLRQAGFNDHANSMIINEGTWELCEHDNYQGTCRVYQPGRYTDLRDMSDRVSSMRRIR